MELKYDLHIHSCLSPCGDNEMTPNNIVNMAIVNGLDVIAITDHNTAGNARAVLEVAGENGILAIAGLELCTCEEIHVVCLFYTLEGAELFSEYLYSCLPAIKNDPTIFGEQLYLDEGDNLLGSEELLLITASTLSITQLPALMRQYHGVAFPAHIDKDSYSVIASLGSIPPECGFRTVEVKRPESYLATEAGLLHTKGHLVLTNSDAHYLWDIAEPTRTLTTAACSAHSVLLAIARGLLAT